MRTLSVFNFLTVNGYYKGLNEDISWHPHGGEETKFSEKGANSGNMLLFGRVTYQLMASFWPTTIAMETMPVVAKGMNNAEKMVFSKTLKKVEWNNSRLVKNNPVSEVKKMKKTAGNNMTILGSGSLVSLLAEHNLIDEYQFMIDPIALGDGTPLFKGMKNKLSLKLTGTKVFKNGIVLLSYQPVR